MPGDRTMMRRLAASLTLGSALLLAALLTPGIAAAAGPISSSACSAVGPAVTCDLWAKPGTATLPGTTTPIWGFASSAAGAATAPGPALIVNSGDVVTVHLTNQLSVTTSILFDGQPTSPDLTGVVAGGTKTYTFTAGAPGTYLYEAGLLPGSQYQVAMGLYGALIVRPTGGLLQANDSVTTAFDDEALVILSEVDTKLTNPTLPATSATFDLRGYAPRYFLINGAAYPQTSPITTASGHRLLVRYLNAGLQHHSMGVLGLRQAIVNDDGSALTYPRRMVAESIAPGQGLDVLIDVPASTATSTKYALFDASMGLNNTTGTGTNAGIGGMLTLIDASGSGTSTDAGPVTSLVTNVVAIDGSSSALSAHLTDINPTDPIGSGVTASEYFIDTIGAPGSGLAMTGAFGGDPVDATATIALGPLATGDHIVYVRGLDGLGNWGTVASATFSKDASGPATSGAVVNPTSANGTANATLTATADDRASGGSNIAGAEYFIDVQGADGAGIPVTPSTTTAPVASLTATIAAATINGLTEGPHAILVHSRDATGAWGDVATVTLIVDKTGPTALTASADPNPNNGALGVNSTNPSIRVTATFDDASPSFVRTGEVFIETLGANGTGIPMVPSDGVFDSIHEVGFADVPLTTITQLSNGNHTIYVRGKDSAGNWGLAAQIVLNIDRSAPTISGVLLTPSSVNAQAVVVTASASDVLTGNHNIMAAELFIDTTGTNGAGIAMTVAAAAPSATITGTIPAGTVAGLTPGNHVVYVHARDVAGNWGPRVSATLKVDRTPPTFTGFNLVPASVAYATASVGLTVTGAIDPTVGGVTGSGVAGGEFWIANSNVPNGGGTAFSGTTATIPTASLVPGTYTVRVRIRDVAGNWSTGTNGVRTRTLTITGAPQTAIFGDGFELQTLPGTWSSASTGTTTRLNVTTRAALTGTFGLEAQGNNTNYVQFDFGTAANPATAIYDARFLFRPNNNGSSGHDILSTATSNTFGTPVFRVRYRRSGASTPQVQIQVGAANANTTWTTLTGGTTNNVIEVVWQAAGSGGPQPGTLRLYVNGTLSQTLTTTSTLSVGAIRLGSVTGGTSNTREYFDAFASQRSAIPFGP